MPFRLQFVCAFTFLLLITAEDICPAMSTIRKIPNRILGVSEPNPRWFGNRENEPSNPSWTNPNWLKSRFHFSFAEYRNPQNMGFGVLRVLNDDLVQPHRGFGEHPHSNVEICTYIVDGFLTHRDSMGTEETLTRGDVQFMTAGRGVEHSEHNEHKTQPLRFLQIWISTRTTGLKPNYGSAIGDVSLRLNKWAHLVSDVSSSVPTPIKINADANIFVTELESGQQATLPIARGRQAYLVCIEDSISLSTSNGEPEQVLERHDAAEIYGETVLTVNNCTPNGRSHVLLIEMAFTGKGRGDIPN